MRGARQKTLHLLAVGSSPVHCSGEQTFNTMLLLPLLKINACVWSARAGLALHVGQNVKPSVCAVVAPVNWFRLSSKLSLLQACVLEGHGLPSGCLVWHVRTPMVGSQAAEQTGALAAQHLHICSSRLVTAATTSGRDCSHKANGRSCRCHVQTAFTAAMQAMPQATPL